MFVLAVDYFLLNFSVTVISLSASMSAKSVRYTLSVKVTPRLKKHSKDL